MPNNILVLVIYEPDISRVRSFFLLLPIDSCLKMSIHDRCCQCISQSLKVFNTFGQKGVVFVFIYGIHWKVWSIMSS